MVGNISFYLKSYRKGGFTLIEMLLVIVIIGIVTAVSVPQFVKSMRGNQRRTAVRMVVSAGRYARSMAVLHQRPMVLTFDIKKSLLLVKQESLKRKPADDKDADEDKKDKKDVSALDEVFGIKDEREPAAAAASVGVADSLERKLDNVSIVSVDVEGDKSCGDGSCSVVYESNGRCIPYEVRLMDSEKEVVTIKVDALASAITVGD